MAATSKGRLYAIRKLRERREASEKREPIDNSAAHAGEPVYLPCYACGAYIEHPEDYLTPIRLCQECDALKVCGWLTE